MQSHFFQIAKFVICDNAQCIYETLPPHMLAVMVLVKIFTYQFNSRKVRPINMNDIDILIPSHRYE